MEKQKRKYSDEDYKKLVDYGMQLAMTGTAESLGLLTHSEANLVREYLKEEYKGYTGWAALRDFG